MKYFCTLFNSHYLSRGLAAYQSLKKNCSDFHLYIFAFDAATFSVLSEMNFENVTVISLKDFEDEQLLSVKQGRTVAEYCWTCTPSVIKYVLDTFNVDSCTYIDSDLYFFSDPSILFDEKKDSSILITRHRFSKDYIQYEKNGIYNVQFMYFKNNEAGRNTISWWRERCIEWCYSKAEDGKFGDQKYLDDWTTRFKEVHVLENTGGGVAPWNVQSYRYIQEKSGITQIDKVTGARNNVIFYHFHNFKIYKEGFAKAIDYPLSADIIDCLYKPYYQHLLETETMLYEKYPVVAGKGYIRYNMDGYQLRGVMNRMKNGNFAGDNIIVNDEILFKKKLHCYSPKQKIIVLFKYSRRVFVKLIRLILKKIELYY